VVAGRTRRSGVGAVVPADGLIVVVVVLLRGAGRAVVLVEVVVLVVEDDVVVSGGVLGGGTMAVEPPAVLDGCSCRAVGAASSVARSPAHEASGPGTATAPARARHAITGRRGTVHLQDQARQRRNDSRVRSAPPASRDDVTASSRSVPGRYVGGARRVPPPVTPAP
jgi:hypothetical protein